MLFPRVNPSLKSAVRELHRELPLPYTVYHFHQKFETCGYNIFRQDLPEGLEKIMIEKITDFTGEVREYKRAEKEREREQARATLAGIFEELTSRDSEPRAALLIALDPLCFRLRGGESLSIRSELAPQFSQLSSGEITATLLKFGSRSHIVKVAQSLRRDLIKVKRDCPLGVSFSIKRVDNFINKFNPPQEPATPAEEQEGENTNGFQPSENQQSL